MQRNKTFLEFMQDFETANGKYILKGPPKNEYRHFGEFKDGKQYFSYNELLYLFSPVPPKDATLEARAYFELKNAGLNILGSENGAMVYLRTKHFNRKKEIPMGRLVFQQKHERICKMDGHHYLCIMGDDAFCFVETTDPVTLSKNTELSLLK